MKKPVQCGIAAVLIIFSLSGCVVNSTGIVTKDQLLGSPRRTIQAVTTVKESLIVFDQNGARLNSYNDVISGELINGSKAVIPFEQIRSFRTEVPAPSGITSYAGKTIKAVLLINNSFVEFAGTGAVYSPSDQRISGINTEGQKNDFSVLGIKEFYDRCPAAVSSEDIKTLKISSVRQVCLIENNEVLTFNGGGGKYRPEAVLITGTNNRGEKVWLSDEDISSYTVRGVDVTATIFANAAIGAAAVGAAAAVLIGGGDSTFSIDIGESIHIGTGK